MDRQTVLDALTRVRAQKQASSVDDTQAFAAAMAQSQNQEMKARALNNIKNVALMSLGVGAGGRGLVGLIGKLRGDLKPRTSHTGPALLPLPYPVEPDEEPERIRNPLRMKTAASSVTGLPWYTPAVTLTALGGLGVGWKGLDKILDARRKAEREKELESARSEFRDALLSQYDRPVPGKKMPSSIMTKVGEELDALYAETQAALVKTADLGDVGRHIAGYYGTYAALSGLLSGAIVYDKAKKRSQRAILDKAIKRRAQRAFAQQPTEVYAVPEPNTVVPKPPPFRQEMASLAEGV